MVRSPRWADGLVLALAVGACGNGLEQAASSSASEGTGDDTSATASSSATLGPATGTTMQGASASDGTGGVAGTDGGTTSADASTSGDGELSTTAASTGTSTHGSSGRPPASCDEIYGRAPGYIFCGETERACSFNATTDGTCADMCSAYGGMCLEAFDNTDVPGDECIAIKGSTDTCKTTRYTELCVCDKP